MFSLDVPAANLELFVLRLSWLWSEAATLPSSSSS